MRGTSVARFSVIWVLVAGTVLLTTCGGQAATQYRLTGLGTFPGGSWSHAYGVNDAGQVVGESECLYEGPEPGTCYNVYGFVWQTGSGMRDLGDRVYVDCWSEAYSINATGQIVGSRGEGYGGSAFMWSAGGGMQAIPGMYCAYDVNDSGLAAGIYLDDYRQACVGNPTAGAVSLGGMWGVTPKWSEACSINNGGQVVGTAYFQTGNDEGCFSWWGAFIWDAAAGMSPVAEDAWGYGVNDSGQVVGMVLNGVSQYEAFLWESEPGLRMLGTLQNRSYSEARAINGLGQIVGTSGNRDPLTGTISEHRAFLWTESDGMGDLNELVDYSGDGWVLEYARDINNSGQIVGYGKNPSGQMEAFFLTPVPEPSSLLALVCGLGGIGGMVWRRRVVGA